MFYKLLGALYGRLHTTLLRWPRLAEKANVTVWRPSVCLSRWRILNGTHQSDSMRRGQRTFPSAYYEDGRIL